MSIDLFGFLTTYANDVVRPYHPKAMPAVLEPGDAEAWLATPWQVAQG